MFRLNVAASILFLLLGLAPGASADSVTWTLHDVLFSDGATASGSFVYDASTNKVSAVNITTTGGSLFGGATYRAVDPSFTPLPFDIGFVVTLMPDFTGSSALELEFFTSNSFAVPLNLTNAGGTVFTALNEFACLNAACTSVNDLRGTTGDATIVGAVSTRETSTLLLVGIGLLGLCAVNKRYRFI